MRQLFALKNTNQPTPKNFQKGVAICQAFLNDHLIEKVYRNVLERIRHIKKEALRSYEKLSNNLIDCEVAPDQNINKQFTKEEFQPQITFVQPKLGAKKANIKQLSQSIVNKTLKKLQQNLQQDIKQIDIYNACTSFLGNIHQNYQVPTEKGKIKRGKGRGNLRIAKKGMMSLHQYNATKSTLQGKQNIPNESNEQIKLLEIQNQLRQKKIKQAQEFLNEQKKKRRKILGSQTSFNDKATKTCKSFLTSKLKMDKNSMLPQTLQKNQNGQENQNDLNRSSLSSSDRLTTFTFDDNAVDQGKKLNQANQQINQNLQGQSPSSYLAFVKQNDQPIINQQRIGKTAHNFRRLNSVIQNQRKLSRSHFHRISGLKQSEAQFKNQALRVQNIKQKNTVFLEKCSRIKQSFFKTRKSNVYCSNKLRSSDQISLNPTFETQNYHSIYQTNQIFNSDILSKSQQNQKNSEKIIRRQCIRNSYSIAQKRTQSISVVNHILFEQIFSPKQKLLLKNQTKSSHLSQQQSRINVIKTACCSRKSKYNIKNSDFIVNMTNLGQNQCENERMAMTLVPNSLMERKKLFCKFQRGSLYTSSAGSFNKSLRQPFVV